MFRRTHLPDVSKCIHKFLNWKWRFCDLGSGDGLIVDYANTYTRCAIGIEADRELWTNSRRQFAVWNVDLFDVDLSALDVIYYYLMGCSREDELAAKLAAEAPRLIITYHRGAENRRKPFRENLGQAFAPLWEDPKRHVVVYNRISDHA